MTMFSTKKVDNQKAVEALMEEAGDFTESGYLFTDDYMEKLARSVFVSSRLPDNDDYVKVIGHGYEKSNLEAIHTLIMNNLDTLCEIHGIHHLERALELLEERFRNVESFFSA